MASSFKLYGECCSSKELFWKQTMLFTYWEGEIKIRLKKITGLVFEFFFRI